MATEQSTVAVDPSWAVLQGDAREVLATLDAGSVQTCVTSPPYFGLRDYGHDGQIGLESTPDEFVAALVDVFREVRRVLADDGTVWLNLGDTYADNANGRLTPAGRESRRGDRAQVIPPKRGLSGDLKPKDLIGVPWMAAFALRSDGWYLRADVIWHKPNPMPESVTDRPTRAHEYVFLLSKSARYFYDQDAIREPHEMRPQRRPGGRPEDLTPRPGQPRQAWSTAAREEVGVDGHPLGRNKRSVWRLTTQPFPGAHFATFPPKLIEPCILAGSREGDTVLDPFSGAGTTGLVALRRGRSYVGVELNSEYVELSRERIIADAPLLNTPAEAAA